MTHRGVIKQPWSSAVRTPEKGPRRLPGLLEPSELFHGGPPVRFRRRGWYRGYPPQSGSLGASRRSVGSSSASGSRGLHGDAAGRLPGSTTGVIHKRPCGWSFGDRLRARVDNPERGRRQSEERRSGLTEEAALVFFIPPTPRRRHSALNYGSPIEYESRYWGVNGHTSPDLSTETG